MSLADELITVLDDPTHMWTHALKELSTDAQRLFLTLTMLPKPVPADILQVAFTAEKVNRSESFLDSLRSLEDSFISIGREYANRRAISFRNPSLQDFANAHLDANTDWLDSLLSCPKYFEQIISAYSLAMSSRTVLVNPKTRARRPGQPKYPGIKSWVARQESDLATQAIGLLGSSSAEMYRDNQKSRIGQLLEIFTTWGVPTADSALSALREPALEAILPDDQESADAMLQILENPTYRGLLDRFAGSNAATAMRTHILDKDFWKFHILARLDNLLDRDWDDSWESWGSDYIDYAKQLAEDLKDSNDDDALRSAINEINGIYRYFDFDLHDEVEILEQRRRDLPADEDYDEERIKRPPSDQADDTTQLDRIFSSLL